MGVTLNTKVMIISLTSSGHRLHHFVCEIHPQNVAHNMHVVGSSITFEQGNKRRGLEW